MRRREFVAGLGSVAAAMPVPARAQSSTPVIGLLSGNSPEASAQIIGSFRVGLHEGGYDEGRNVRIEYRFAYNDLQRYQEIASEVVRSRVTVIVIAASGPLAHAAKGATSEIPIVFGTAGDPVQEGLVESLNKPGGNATGFTNMAIGLAAKRLEILHQAVPNAARVALLVTPTSNLEVVKVTRGAAEALGLGFEVVNVGNNHDLGAAFASIVDNKAQALMVPTNPFFTNSRPELIALASHHKMPTMYYDRPYAEAGGLISYGSSLLDQARQVGVYTCRVLQGEKPANLPVQQSTKIELVVNLKTARALGLTIPETLLAIADEVIQ
jgi:putative tryptophan/tyrosine transport system substrate-binding protein